MASLLTSAYLEIADRLHRRGVATAELRRAAVCGFVGSALAALLPGGGGQAARLLELLAPELLGGRPGEGAPSEGEPGSRVPLNPAAPPPWERPPADPAQWLAAAYEASLPLETRGGGLETGRGRRRAAGAFFTPPYLATYLAGRTIRPPLAGRLPTLLDPAMGAASLLLAGVRALSSRTGLPVRRLLGCLYGVDRDPLAVAAGRLVLWLAAAPHELPAADEAAGLRARLRSGHALLGPGQAIDGLDWAAAFPEAADGFDLLLANPPWGAALASGERAALRQAFPALTRGEFNIYTIFLAQACRWVRPGGRAGLIVPEGWLVNRGTAGLRRMLLAGAALEEVAVLRKGVFPAAPDTVPVLAVLRPGAATGPVRVRLFGFSRPIRELPGLAWQVDHTVDGRHWGNLPHGIFPVARRPEHLTLYRQVEALGRPLAESGLARLSDGVYKTRLMPRLAPPDGDAGLPAGFRPALVAAAEAGDYRVQWQGWRISPAGWAALPAAERQRAAAAKLIFHALKKPGAPQRVACCWDPGEGETVPGTRLPGGLLVSNNFITLIPGSGAPDLRYLMALFNSAVLNRWYADHFIQVNIEAFTLGAVPIRPVSNGGRDPERLACWLACAAGAAGGPDIGPAGRLLREVADLCPPGPEPIPGVVHDLIAHLAGAQQAAPSAARRQLLEQLVACLYGLPAPPGQKAALT